MLSYINNRKWLALFTCIFFMLIAYPLSMAKQLKQNATTCLDPEISLLALVQSEIIKPNYLIDQTSASIVRAPGNPAIHFLAAELQGFKLDGIGEIGLWAIWQQSSHSAIISPINQFAHAYSQIDHREDMDASLNFYSPGAKQAWVCVYQKLQR